MSLTEIKKCFKEATEREGKQGGSSALKAMGSMAIFSIFAGLYGAHMLDTGRHLGRMDVLSNLHKATEELESINEDINKN